MFFVCFKTKIRVVRNKVLLLSEAKQTAVAQPSDLGFYCQCQATYKSRWNRLGKKKFEFKRHQQVFMALECIREVSEAVLSACWSRSALSALRPKEPTTLPPDVEAELESAYAEFENQFEADFDETPALNTLVDTPGPSSKVFAHEYLSTQAESETAADLGTLGLISTFS